MIDTELNLLRENPSWLAVLQAYASVFETLAAEEVTDVGRSQTDAQRLDPDAAPDVPDTSSSERPATGKPRRRQPWAPRLTGVAGIETEELSRIHGRLIAYGLLKCDLADRTSGVVYQLTAEARQALAGLAVSADSDRAARDTPAAVPESSDSARERIARSA